MDTITQVNTPKETLCIRREWTQADHDFIMNCVKKGHPVTGQPMTSAAIAKHMGRTKPSVASYLHYHGIDKPRGVYAKSDKPRAKRTVVKKPVRVDHTVKIVNSDFTKISLAAKNLSDMVDQVRDLETNNRDFEFVNFEVKKVGDSYTASATAHFNRGIASVSMSA